MFYHGIDWEYVEKEYPLLSPRRNVSRKHAGQLADRVHLLEQFGVEPVHLLEEGPDFSAERCITECLVFGNTVFAFERIGEPYWQLSNHEVGIETLDLRKCSLIITSESSSKVQVLFRDIPIFSIKSP
ncbi:hypothetical protein NDK47_19025 [Brevibacillus ruminantium]|uniref:Uncharacterized protein n=1 Tax=Brevibacillus ruminantium TaxID=2950604 RepID=A0ABY4WAP8_9BACL|nr:hypothetical protein [Brevibacillus ruminantium]USG64235.1 hypothetical protein NDK47_19025 [Brevibacillus ruminantium]